ncbi:carotenoid oxygenase family protein [Pendulispora rubella]|uniref:Carotenoid oxygenase family protein n=1 Tax=Pendulispora rubella TaxID=2741070 RepID=A0ABZ2KXZ5_9BACT
MNTTTAAAELAKRAPFVGPSEDDGSARARVTGTLPEWLRGTLVRTAPMFGASLPWEPTHLFDAVALAYGIDVGGPEATLHWARIDSETARAARTGRVPSAQFQTRNGRGFFQRLFGPIPKATDNPNVNVVRMGNDVVALTESPHQWRLDPVTLRACGRVEYHDSLGRSAIMLAHPIIGPDGVTNIAYRLGSRAEIMLYTHDAASRARKLVATWSTPNLPYLHSFGLTERSAIVVAHPFTAKPASMLWSNAGFIEHFRWHPERGTRLVVFDRTAGPAQTAREYETDSLFVFHVAHAFETADAAIVDVLAFDDPSIIASAMTRTLLARAPELPAKLRRLTIDRRTGQVRNELLSDTPFELPQVDAERAAGRAATTVFGASVGLDRGVSTGDIVAIDPRSGSARRFREAPWIFGEPVFVGKPGRAREGEGVLLAVGSHEHASALFALDASTLDVLARAEFRTPLPFGFHGSFLPS